MSSNAHRSCGENPGHRFGNSCVTLRHQATLTQENGQPMMRRPFPVRGQPRQPAAIELLGAKPGVQLPHVLVFALTNQRRRGVASRAACLGSTRMGHSFPPCFSAIRGRLLSSGTSAICTVYSGSALYRESRRISSRGGTLQESAQRSPKQRRMAEWLSA
jgi:hypothetical protein